MAFHGTLHLTPCGENLRCPLAKLANSSDERTLQNNSALWLNGGKIFKTKQRALDIKHLHTVCHAFARTLNCSFPRILTPSKVTTFWPYALPCQVRP